MGAVVETPSIYLDMTAEDNLKQQALVLGLPSYESISEILKLVGLENTAENKTGPGPHPPGGYNLAPGCWLA